MRRGHDEQRLTRVACRPYKQIPPVPIRETLLANDEEGGVGATECVECGTYGLCYPAGPSKCSQLLDQPVPVAGVPRHNQDRRRFFGTAGVEIRQECCLLRSRCAPQGPLTRTGRCDPSVVVSTPQSLSLAYHR